MELPKWRDVGPVLIEMQDRFPGWFRELIPELAAASRWLRREREPSMYGDEETDIPPTRLYTRPYAAKAVEACKVVYEAVSRLLREYVGGD